jgi:hypothetical protein
MQNAKQQNTLAKSQNLNKNLKAEIQSTKHTYKLPKTLRKLFKGMQNTKHKPILKCKCEFPKHKI